MNTMKIGCLVKNLLAESSNDYKFLGVHPKDDADKIVKRQPKAYPACYVANTRPHSHPGEHWVVFFWKSADHLEFYDSLGQTPRDYKFFIPNQTITYMLPCPLQSMLSNVCGHYCVLFSWYRCTNLATSPSTMYSLLNTQHVSKNDRIVKGFVDVMSNSSKLCTLSTQHCNSDQCCTSKTKWCRQ